jgi:hypothetical protein
MSGPSEEDTHAVEDTGLSVDDVKEMVAEYKKTMDAAFEEIVKRNAFAWYARICSTGIYLE